MNLRGFFGVEPVSAVVLTVQCRGFLVNSELEREIWARAFKSVLKVDPASSSLLLTEAPFALPAIDDLTAQVQPALARRQK